jgi:hypothetical protein
MRKGFMIDDRGQLWPASRPHRRSAGPSGTAASEAAPCLLYIGPARNGIEMILSGESIPARALAKVLHMLGLMRPKRIAFIQFDEGGDRIRLFPGVWEFAEYAGEPAQACLPEPVLEPSGGTPTLLSLL